MQQEALGGPRQKINESPLSLCSGTEVHFTTACVVCGLSVSQDAGVTEERGGQSKHPEQPAVSIAGVVFLSHPRQRSWDQPNGALPPLPASHTHTPLARTHTLSRHLLSPLATSTSAVSGLAPPV